MLINNLFFITNLEVEEGTLVAEIRLDAGHNIFEGHFPGAPVTPGVVQLQIVKEILELHLEKKLRMKTMRTCKFLEVINPVTTPVLVISIKFTEGEMLDVTSSGSFNGISYFKAQISYTSQPESLQAS